MLRAQWALRSVITPINRVYTIHHSCSPFFSLYSWKFNPIFHEMKYEYIKSTCDSLQQTHSFYTKFYKFNFSKIIATQKYQLRPMHLADTAALIYYLLNRMSIQWKISFCDKKNRFAYNTTKTTLFLWLQPFS